MCKVCHFGYGFGLSVLFSVSGFKDKVFLSLAWDKIQGVFQWLWVQRQVLKDCARAMDHRSVGFLVFQLQYLGLALFG